jgi:hypothetical protein
VLFRPLHFPATFVLIVVHALAAEPAKSPKAESIAREAIRDFKFQPKMEPTEISPVLQSSHASDAPVMMPVYTVKAAADRTLQDLNEVFAQQERLKSPALIAFKKIPLEVLLPPKIDSDSAGQPRLILPILNLRW